MSNSRKISLLGNIISNTGTLPITSISDIEISSVAGSQALIYDSITGKWKNNTINITSTGTSDQVNTSTGFFMIPSGTTAQRPVSPQYGALRYNTTTGLAEVYSPNGWSIFGTPPPQVSSVSPTTYNGESGTSFTVNGAYFTNDVGVKFIDSSNTEYNAATVTLVNSSTLTVTTPQDFTVTQGPLDIKIIQASGITTLTDCISTGSSPSWTTTAGQIGGTIYRNGSVITSVAATDPDSGATISYSVYSGSLPTGLSLNTSTGAITGTAPNVGSDTTYNFTVRATDNAGNIADRAFSMSVLQGSPGMPTIGTATRSASQSVQIAFTTPANTGGSAITTYTATSNPGGLTGTSATSPITVTGLTNGTAYTFTVTATNSYGTSVASSASNSATPSTTPSAPTIGTATVVNGGTATVTFTASSSNGGATITSYTAVSSPGGVTGTLSQAGSGTITVNGLTSGTAYTFTVYATNAAGNSSNSSASNSIIPVTAPGQAEYTSPGTYTWYAPAGVTSVSAVAIGSGAAGTAGGPTYNGIHANGGGGGGLGWKNNISVTPGAGYTVVVGQGGYQPGANWQYDDEGPANQQAGADSYFISSTTVKGGGAPKPLLPWTQTRNSGGTYTGDGGGNGGTGGYQIAAEPNGYVHVGLGGGGGGAGGYSGAGGDGALGQVNGTGTAGSGGGGGGGGCGGVDFYGDPGMYTHGSNAGKTGGGGGVGLYGQGSSGSGGQYLNNATSGGGGSGGVTSSTWNGEQYGFNGGGNGGAYGGGGGGNASLFDATYPGTGGNGAVRIMWGGGRSYPSNAANA